MTSILLAEDHQIVREGFRSILESQDDLRVVGETGDGLEVLPLLETARPDVLVVDLLLPGLHGLEILRRAREHYPWIATVVLSMYDDLHYVRAAMRREASAYVLKESGTEVLLAAIQAAVHDEWYLDPALPFEPSDVAEAVNDHQDDELDPYSFLTDREREVLQLTAEGLTMKETAARLNISARTVERHRANMMKKLGFRNQADLVRLAVYRGLVGPLPEHD